MKKIVKVAVLALIGFYVAFCLLLFVLQESFIFRSEEISQDYVYNFSTKFKEVSFAVDEGEIVHGIHFQRENPKGIILYCHGNTGDARTWGQWASSISKKFNYDIVVWDYRGYGKSNGDRSMKKMLNDGSRFYDYCQAFMPSGEESVIVWGRSLGGAFASHIAAEHQPAKVILESTFTEISIIAKGDFPILPMDLLLRFPLQSIENVKKIKSPTAIIHGTVDQRIPYQMGEQLYDNTQSKEKKLYTIENGSHNNLSGIQSYHQALSEILE